MVLVPLKKTLTLYFAMVHLYCSLKFRFITYGFSSVDEGVDNR